jgi:hypothetical protein
LPESSPPFEPLNPKPFFVFYLKSFNPSTRQQITIPNN